MINKIVEFIQNPVKTFIATATGAVTGSVPEITSSQMNNFDVGFQHTVWTVTIILGFLGIISAVQKQIDRYKNIKK